MNRVVTYTIIGVFMAIAMIIVMLSIHTPCKIENPVVREVASPLNARLQMVASAPYPAPSHPNPAHLVTTSTPGTVAAPGGTNIQRTIFGNGIPFQASDLPASSLRRELEGLPPGTRAFAMSQLTKMSFHINDLNSLHVDQSGMPYYTCTFSNATPTNIPQAAPAIAKSEANIPINDHASVEVMSATSPNPGILADVPITAPPIRHSRPGATRVLFLDFNGQVITNTAWNNNASYGNVSRWDCRPFDTDGNPNTFNNTEQLNIISIWERVAEDYAPFNIDVTTEQPTNWTSTTGHALITPDTDINGIHCPHYGFGGIAYVNVFGGGNYSYNSASCYSPVFVLPMSSSSYADTAEAVSHELGHNMGLSHDGTSTAEYYGGHGSGDVSWGPIMGTGYGRNVSQWSKGEYYDANQTQDDLSIISAKAPYRTDDHGNTSATASQLTTTNGTLISSGIISSNNDVDVFSFSAGAGSLSITVFPYRCANGTYGGNLDVFAQLYNSSGSLVASDNPTNLTQAIINYTAPVTGTYYLYISNSGTGDPTNNPPSGYTPYGSIGQYFITGRVALITGLLVQTPNGGELWYIGQTNNIIWLSGTNIGENVRIELYRSGNLYNTITNSVTNSGSFAWLIANPILNSSNFQIHVSSVTQPAVRDAGDTTFTITTAPSITMLFENFDAGTSIPSGWSQTNLSGTATTWKFQSGGKTGGINPTGAFSGANNACLYDTTISPDICRLSTPPINLAGCTGAVLRFQHYMQLRTTRQDYLNIWASTNSPDSWFWVAGYSNSVANWTQHTLTLPNPSTHYTIAFEGIANNGYGVCLDDVEVIGYPEVITSVTNNTPLSWLADYGLEPTDTGALSDTDHDGMQAWEEWVAGTIPTQFLSVLKVSNSWNAANGHILHWSSVTGRTYSISWSSNLLTEALASIVTNNTTGIYTDTIHTVEQNGFYRIGVQMGP